MSQDFDATMRNLAARRGQVIVTEPDRTPRVATPICWRPNRKYRARIDYRGTRYSVSAHWVEPLTEVAL